MRHRARSEITCSRGSGGGQGNKLFKRLGANGKVCNADCEGAQMSCFGLGRWRWMAFGAAFALWLVHSRWLCDLSLVSSNKWSNRLKPEVLNLHLDALPSTPCKAKGVRRRDACMSILAQGLPTHSTMMHAQHGHEIHIFMKKHCGVLLCRSRAHSAYSACVSTTLHTHDAPLRASLPDRSVAGLQQTPVSPVSKRLRDDEAQE